MFFVIFSSILINIFSVLIVLVFLLGIFLVISKLKIVLKYINGLSDELRKFIYKNDSFFEIFFLFLFTSEQMLLSLLIYFFPKQANLILIFLIPFILGTTSLKHIIYNIKRRESDNISKQIYKDYNEWLEDIESLLQENDELRKENSKLKKRKS